MKPNIRDAAESLVEKHVYGKRDKTKDFKVMS